MDSEHITTNKMNMETTDLKYGIERQQAPELNVGQWVNGDGKPMDAVKLADHAGKFRVIYCFQSWCPGCHSVGLPSLQTMVQELGDNEKVEFFAIQTVFEGSHANTYEKMLEVQKKYDLHIHIPEGAIPKDGPSAGITMCTAIVSTLTKRPVHRDLAMTGEITLRGRILPIGGLKEKILAAHRGGIKKILIPMENKKDLKDIPTGISKQLEIVPVNTIEEVLVHALLSMPEPLSEEDTPKTADLSPKSAENKGKDVIHH